MPARKVVCRFRSWIDPGGGPWKAVAVVAPAVRTSRSSVRTVRRGTLLRQDVSGMFLIHFETPIEDRP